MEWLHLGPSECSGARSQIMLECIQLATYYMPQWASAAILLQGETDRQASPSHQVALAFVCHAHVSTANDSAHMAQPSPIAADPATGLSEELTQSLQRLLLEAVANGTVASAQDIQRLLQCTLAGHQLPYQLMHAAAKVALLALR